MSYAPIGESSELENSRSTAMTEEDDDDVVTVRSGMSRKSQLRLPAELSEPLTHNNGGPSTQDDPFYVFRSDLYRKLEYVDESLAEFLRVVHQTDTAVNTHELKDIKKQLKHNIKNAEATIKDVSMTVHLIENDRDKFHHVSEQELYERRTFVQTSKDRIHRAKQDIQSEAVKAKLLADERAKAQRRAGDNHRYGAQTQAQQESTDYIVDSQARASLLMEHQDETLDVLGEAVGRVNEMAGAIHEEVSQQNKMLSEMEEDLSNVEEELGIVMGKLAKFLKTKDTWQLKTILILSAIMMVLLMLVLYS